MEREASFVPRKQQTDRMAWQRDIAPGICLISCPWLMVAIVGDTGQIGALLFQMLQRHLGCLHTHTHTLVKSALVHHEQTAAASISFQMIKYKFKSKVT
jgi:hypothetical protein